MPHFFREVFMSIKITGLEELLKVLEGTSVTTSLVKASKDFSKEVQGNLFALTSTKYNISKSELGKSFLNRSETLTGSVLTVRLNYQHKPTNLGARLAYRAEGNLAFQGEKKRSGIIHVVEVKRGVQKVSRGKHKRGGFIPKRQGSRWKGSYMYERKTRAKYPIVPILTLSAAQATEQVFFKDKEFDSYLSLLGDKLLSKTSETVFS